MARRDDPCIPMTGAGSWTECVELVSRSRVVVKHGAAKPGEKGVCTGDPREDIAEVLVYVVCVVRSDLVDAASEDGSCLLSATGGSSFREVDEPGLRIDIPSVPKTLFAVLRLGLLIAGIRGVASCDSGRTIALVLTVRVRFEGLPLPHSVPIQSPSVDRSGRGR